jgi:hypothetical protein
MPLHANSLLLPPALVCAPRAGFFDHANANRRRRRRGDCHDLSFVDRRAGAENFQFAGYAHFRPPTQIFQQHDFAAFAATMKNPLTFGQKNSCQAQRARYQDDRAS